MLQGTAKKKRFFFLNERTKPLTWGVPESGRRLAVAVSWMGTVIREEEPREGQRGQLYSPGFRLPSPRESSLY